MKVLSIGSDSKLFEEGSAVSERAKWYGSLVEELHIINMCDSKHKFEEKQLAKNIWVYPTNSLTSVLRPIDAVRLGKKIIFEKKFVRGESLITAQDIESGWAGLKIKNKWRIPLEVQLHTDPFSPHFKGFQNKVRQLFMKNVLNGADSIRVVSESLKLKAKSYKLQASISVLPIYVDKSVVGQAPVKFDVHAKYHWKFVLLAVARLTKEKNLGMAIRVLAVIRKKFPSTGLVIVGSGPEEEQLKNLVKKLYLQDFVEFAGWQEDLSSFYKTANVFIQTSFFEGYGLALVEAGLSRIPIVTTAVGIATELEHGRDAYIYSHNSTQGELVEEFAAGVIDLLENNFKRENLKINLKRTLDSKLLSKKEYFGSIQSYWEETAKMVGR